MTVQQAVDQAAASGDVRAYGLIMEELTGWTCREVPDGIAWIDSYGDQSGYPFESIEDLIGETYDELRAAAQMIDRGEA